MKKDKTTSCTGYAFDKAKRCGAKTKRNNGEPCRSPAVKGKSRCRIHGGAKGSGAPLKNTNALKHGLTSQVMRAFKRQVRDELIKSVNCSYALKKNY